MKLSPDKTGVSDQVIRSAIKEDKLYWIGKEKRKRSLIKHALLIHDLATEYPNSGSVAVALSKFQKRLVKKEKIEDPIRPIIAVVTDIAVHNPRIYPIYAAVVSKLLEHLEPDERERAVEQVLAKFKQLPNCGHLYVWMQRFAIPMGIPLEVSEPLCLALKDPEYQLWNSEWLPASLLPLMAAKEYIDQNKLDELDATIDPDEVQLFGYDLS